MNPLRRLRRRRTGQLPEQLRTELAAEGVQLLEEQLSGSITVRGYRAPREYASWKKELVSGALVITRRRLVVWVRGSKHIDLPLGHPMRDALEVVAERPGPAPARVRGVRLRRVPVRPGGGAAAYRPRDPVGGAVAPGPAAVRRRWHPGPRRQASSSG